MNAQYHVVEERKADKELAHSKVKMVEDNVKSLILQRLKIVVQKHVQFVVHYQNGPVGQSALSPVEKVNKNGLGHVFLHNMVVNRVHLPIFKKISLALHQWRVQLMELCLPGLSGLHVLILVVVAIKLVVEPVHQHRTVDMTVVKAF